MGIFDTITGAARYVTHTAGAFAADAGSAASRFGEIVTGTVTGSKPDPATLRLTVLILSDEQGSPLTSADALLPAIATADRILSEQANVRVRHLATHVITEPAPPQALDPRANRQLLLDEALGNTSFYHRQLRAFPETGMQTRSVVGRPITAIVVRQITGSTTGCSLGISADWVIVQAALFDDQSPSTYDETVLAHELGHAMNLPHHPAANNLMYFASSPPSGLRGTRLSAWQRGVVNANRHVIPGVRR